MWEGHELKSTHRLQKRFRMNNINLGGIEIREGGLGIIAARRREARTGTHLGEK